MRELHGPLRVLLADDHLVVRTGLRHLLESDPDFVVVGEADNGHDVLAQAIALKPDLLVLDVSMPRKSGIDALREFGDNTDGMDAVAAGRGGWSADASLTVHSVPGGSLDHRRQRRALAR